MRRRPKRLTAFHEAGHAIAAMVWAGGVTKVTIIPDRFTWGRVTRTGPLPRADSPRAVRRTAALVEARILLAGEAAEEVHTGKPTTNTEALRHAGFLDWAEGYGHEHDFALAAFYVRMAYPRSRIVARRMVAAYDAARTLLETHRAALSDVAAVLLRQLHMNGGELARIIDGHAEGSNVTHPGR